MSFPMEVFEDILFRLPVKPLLRFRCVSPLWRDLIDCPKFVKLHLARSIEADSHLNVILCSSNPRPHAAKLEPSVLSLETTELRHYPFRDEVESEIQVWGSCNGLVCLSNKFNTIALWNPSTREFVKLPDCRFQIRNHEYDMSTYQCRNKFGFGYDKVNDDYKVLNIMDVTDKRTGDVLRYRVKVYSLKSNLWRNVDFHEYHKFPYIRREPGVLAGGALHWVMGIKMDILGLIVAFDLATEKWRTLHFPKVESFNCSLSLGCFGDSICLGVNYLMGYIEYWVMREYGVDSSWSMLFSLVPVCSRPIYFPKSNGEVLMQHNGGLVWFDVENSKPWYKAVHNTEHKYMKSIEVGELKNITQVTVYMESLVTIRGYRSTKDEKKLKENWKNEIKPSPCMNFQLPLTVTIPTDVLENILSWLPVEPLLRFRCVSPLWRNLIDNPHFIKLHLNRSIEAEINLNIITTDLNRKHSLYGAKFKPSIPTLKLKELDHYPLPDDESGIAQVWGSCNGLLCVGSNSNAANIVLWNPSTRRAVNLPPTEYKKEELDNVDISDYSCRSGCGFGYDSVRDDYKVVRVMDVADMYGRVKIYVVKVYSLKSNSWHTVEEFCRFPYVQREYTQLAHNSLHWLMGMEHDEVNMIVAFDLHSETWRIVPGPRFEDTKCQHFLERFQDSISLVSVNCFGFSDLWVMREYGVEDSWAKLFSLHNQFTRPVYFPKNNSEVFMQHDGRLLWCDTENDEDPWYDPEDDTKHEYLRIIEVQGIKRFHRVEMYTASLVPLGRLSKMNKEGPPKAKKKIKTAGFLSKGFNLKL